MQVTPRIKSAPPHQNEKGCTSRETRCGRLEANGGCIPHSFKAGIVEISPCRLHTLQSAVRVLSRRGPLTPPWVGLYWAWIGSDSMKFIVQFPLSSPYLAWVANHRPWLYPWDWNTRSIRVTENLTQFIYIEREGLKFWGQRIGQAWVFWRRFFWVSSFSQKIKWPDRLGTKFYITRLEGGKG